MKTETVSLIRLEPSNGMRLRNKITGEVFRSYIYIAKSLCIDDFEEITEEEYRKIAEVTNDE